MNNAHWPYEWMWASFAVAAAASVAPWFFGRLRAVVAVIAVSLMLGVFACYESLLFSRVGGPNTTVFQLELFLLAPLMLLAIISCTLAAFFTPATSSPS